MSRTADRLTPPIVDIPPPRVPSWQAFLVGFLLAALVGVVGAVAVYVALSRANDHTDHRLATLEADRVERRKAADEANARRDSQIAETRRLVCTVVNRIQPRDVEVERIRAEFKCDQQPDPAPAASPRPS
jgi:hypothetical protein